MSEIDLARRMFRASPAFDLLSLDRVPEKERYAIADLEKRDDVFGLLKPRVPSHGVKVVD